MQYGRFQSTHPSGVRHEAGEVVVLGGGISIHAPQWGATAEVKPLTVAVTNFNPRTPVGCDTSKDGDIRIQLISIHAPQWGATYRHH